MPSRACLPMKPQRLLICLIPMFCAGCGLMPRTGEPSLALHIADEMGIPASDLSRQAYRELARSSSESSTNYEGIVTGALALDPTIMLVGALANPGSARMVQVVAWVPESMASSGGEAAILAEETVRNAVFELSDTQKVEQLKRLRWTPKAIGLPYGDVGIKTYTQLYQITTGYTPDVRPAPSFMGIKEQVYGPLFLGNPIAEGSPQDLANKLPSWVYTYDPGSYSERPKAVYNAGATHLFIEPPQ